MKKILMYVTAGIICLSFAASDLAAIVLGSEKSTEEDVSKDKRGNRSKRRREGRKNRIRYNRKCRSCREIFKKLRKLKNKKRKEAAAAKHESIETSSKTKDSANEAS